MSETEMVPAEVFHIGEYINDELEARGWTLDELAYRMGGDYDVTRLALDLLIEVRTHHCILGRQAAGLARAFGTSEKLWLNLHETWRKFAPETDYDRALAVAVPMSAEERAEFVREHFSTPVEP